ncbi:hypothetical protein CR513_17518, partial [Mucuna pruriens]
MLVDINYFTKWIEAEPLAMITTQKYGIPNSMVTNNGTQFVSKSLREFYEELQITYKVTSVEHPKHLVDTTPRFDPEILESLYNDAYHLEQLDDTIIPRTWNSMHLKYYFT